MCCLYWAWVWTLPSQTPPHDDNCRMHSFLCPVPLSPFQILSWWKMRWKPLDLENFNGSCLFSPAWRGQVFLGVVSSHSVSKKPPGCSSGSLGLCRRTVLSTWSLCLNQQEFVLGDPGGPEDLPWGVVGCGWWGPSRWIWSFWLVKWLSALCGSWLQ